MLKSIRLRYKPPSVRKGDSPSGLAANARLASAYQSFLFIELFLFRRELVIDKLIIDKLIIDKLTPNCHLFRIFILTPFNEIIFIALCRVLIAFFVVI